MELVVYQIPNHILMVQSSAFIATHCLYDIPIFPSPQQGRPKPVGSVCRKRTSNCCMRRQEKEKVTKSLSIILLHLNNCTNDTGGCPGACGGRVYKQWVSV